MQQHADEGARIIDRLGFLNDAVPAIRHHHERFDGAGYPDRPGGRGDPARRADHPRRRRARLDADDARSTEPAGRREDALDELQDGRRHASSARAASRRSRRILRVEATPSPPERAAVAF